MSTQLTKQKAKAEEGAAKGLVLPLPPRHGVQLTLSYPRNNHDYNV